VVEQFMNLVVESIYSRHGEAEGTLTAYRRNQTLYADLWDKKTEEGISACKQMK